MPAEPVPVPVPDPASPIPPEAAAQPMGDIFRLYNPGNPEDMFAPAYLKGFKPSEDALAAWTAYHRNVTPGMIDELRMPNEYRGPPSYSAGNGVYGGPIPLQQTYGDVKGQIDPEALRSMSQGIHYDIGARRNAIAARLAANAAAQSAQAPAPIPLDDGKRKLDLMGGMAPSDMSGRYNY